MGYILVLTDSTHRFAPLEWASHKPHRVCRGSTAGDLLALADAYAASLDIRTLLQELLSQRVPIDLYSDSATAYNLVTSFQDPADMSGKNYLFTLRRALLDGTLNEINHISGEDNPADPLSKPTFSRPKPNGALSAALKSGLLNVRICSHTTTESMRASPRDELNMT